MRIDRISLVDFRNYLDEVVGFSPGLNLVVGRNAQGKTNLLEAVHCLSGLGSPRAESSALVREGAERALIHSSVARGHRSLDVDMELKPGRGTRILINKNPVQRLRALGELVVTVFFGPDELSLVKGSPDGRRRFLDDLFVKLKPTQYAVRREFERVLKQRNALLRQQKGDHSPEARKRLTVWDEALARSGAALAAARLRAVADLVPYAQKRYSQVAGSGALRLGYVSSWLPADRATVLLADPSAIAEPELAEGIDRRRNELATAEVERGATLAGPQRDDLSVALESASSGVTLDARTYASQGDQRTTALALKLAEHDLLTDRLSEEPILLLDDVFSELDAHRRGWLADNVRGIGQTLITAAEPLALDVLRPDALIRVDGGKVTRDE